MYRDEWARSTGWLHRASRRPCEGAVDWNQGCSAVLRCSGTRIIGESGSSTAVLSNAVATGCRGEYGLSVL